MKLKLQPGLSSPSPKILHLFNILDLRFVYFPPLYLLNLHGCNTPRFVHKCVIQEDGLQH